MRPPEPSHELVTLAVVEVVVDVVTAASCSRGAAGCVLYRRAASSRTREGRRPGHGNP
jgi:hypothetical protein